MKVTVLTPAFALLLATSVVLSGAHAKELLALSAVADATYKQTDSINAKIGLDLHPHVDKHFSKIPTDVPQADSRSLRLREAKKLPLNAIRGWLSAWRDQFALYLG